MKDIEKDVCTLEHAKELKKWGIFQESCFYWYEFYNEYSTTPNELLKQLVAGDGRAELEETLCSDNVNSYSAFSVAELGRLLPEDASWYTESYCGIWYARHVKISNNKIETLRRIEADTEVEARAKLLLYFLENKIITTKEINE